MFTENPYDNMPLVRDALGDWHWKCAGCGEKSPRRFSNLVPVTTIRSYYLTHLNLAHQNEIKAYRPA